MIVKVHLFLFNLKKFLAPGYLLGLEFLGAFRDGIY